ncbi:MAG: hypothetical protein LC122_11650 [Chitinophagales bacterium]|nr:hypothetical protein [Chitinophagales bacterium]
MKEYYALLDQGSGCDYTIDCGKKLIRLGKFNSIDEAVVKLKNMEGFYYNFDENISDPYYLNYSNYNETSLDNVKILECTNTLDLDLDEMSKEFKEAEMLHNQKMKENEDRKLYESLKKRFEK